MSITAVTPQQIENLNLTSTDSIQLISPGLVFDRGFAYAQTFIRGVGTNLPNPGLEGAVATYVDGGYLQRSIGTVADMFDIGQVQVLKGPQGTLYGRNATGGAILLSTADPTDTRSLHLAQEYGRFDHQLTEAVANLPLTDTLSVRIGGRASSQDGFITNLNDGGEFGFRDSQILRAKAKWTPIEGFTSVLGVEYSEMVDGNNGIAERAAAPNCVGCADPRAQSPVSGFYDVDNSSSSPTRTRARSVNLHMGYKANSLSFDSVSAIRDEDTAVISDQDYTGAPLFKFDAKTGGRAFTQELQAATDYQGLLNGMVGLSYLHDNAYFDADISGDAFGPLNPVGKNDVQTDSYSGFAEAYVTPTPRLKLTAGGRYTHDKRSLSGHINGDVIFAQFAPAGSPSDFEQSDSFNSFTPRVVLAYQFDLVNAYASWNRGFKAGGYSTPAFAPSVGVDPEKIDNFELGSKYVSEDRRLRLNAATFLYLYRDIQVPIVDLTAGGLITQNAGKARGYGFETDGQYAVVDWLDLIGGLALLHARYTQYEAAQVNNAGPTGLSKATEDLEGAPLSRAPNLTASLGAQVHTVVWGSWLANASVIGRYTSEYDFYPGRGGNLRYDYQPAYTLVNLTATLGPESGAYTAGIYVNNLTDEKYYLQRATSAPFGVVDQVAQPMTFGVRFTASFE
ncbi:MAG: hypothetical protein JWQ90_2528 [Hydrocarboniphaga sp.]|nr:hypothetical protein [Hydrocarboniphaga sp.]